MSYDYDKDPLWHTEQKANAFDRVWFYHCDHLGTPQEMSDQTGVIVWTANYKAWGECKTENHTKRDIWDSEIITNNIRFQGQYYDEETGLHYNRYRYYSPYVGRFISKDPIRLDGGINIYNYTSNPIIWIDPLGLKENIWVENWKQTYGTLPANYQVHHIISKDGKTLALVKQLCPNFDEHSSSNLIALPNKNITNPTKTGSGFGKTYHYAGHGKYSESVKNTLRTAIRFKTTKFTGCQKLKAIQAGLKDQLEKGGQTDVC